MTDETKNETRARRDVLVHRAREFHDALTAAIEGLERALAAAASTRTEAWSERVASELSRLRDRIDEVDRAIRAEHVDLVERAEALAHRVPARPDADFGSLRRDIAAVLAALRAHRGFEADLVFEAFWSDLGAPD